MDTRPRIQPWRPATHSRSSSWDSHIDDSLSPVSPETDAVSPSCFTLAESTLNSSTMSSLGLSGTGTIHMTLAASPVSPESVTSSLAAAAWPPLDVRNGGRGRAGEASAPPMPEFRLPFVDPYPPPVKLPRTNPPQATRIVPQNVGYETQHVTIHNVTHTHIHNLNYSASMRSEYPEIVDKTPSDTGNFPSLPYGTRLHVPSQVDLRLQPDDKPFHTDITPGQSQPLQLPDSPALESYYKGETSYKAPNTTTNSGGTKVTIVSGPQILIPAARSDLNSPAFSFEQTPKATPHNSSYVAPTNASRLQSNVSAASSRRSSTSSMSSIDVNDDSDEEDNVRSVASRNAAPPIASAAQVAAQAATASSAAGPSYSGFNFNSGQKPAFQQTTFRFENAQGGYEIAPAPAASVPKTTSKPVPAPIVLKSPPVGEWHAPPQTPIRSLSLAHRPVDPATLPTLPARAPPSAAWSPQSQASPPTQNSQSPPSHVRSDSSSSTTRLMGRTRSFSGGNKPSPFKLNPGNQQYPAPPSSVANSNFSLRPPTSKFSDDGDDSKKQKKASKNNQWTVHFTTPLTLSIFFLCGLISAALHHIYYSQLNDTYPGSMQRWHTSAGIAISMFTIACWAACVAICYRQSVWSTLMKTDVKISGIDALWGLIQDPSLFLVGEAWRKSRISMMLGLFIWILPVTIFLVPGSLTVFPQLQEHNAACVVPSFNPPTEEQAKLLSQAPLAEIMALKPKKTLNMMVNSTKTVVLSNESKRLLTVSSFSGDIVDYAIPEACQAEGECSYNLSFTAPGYKCDAKTKEEASKGGPWGVDFDGLFSLTGEKVYFYSGKASTAVQSGGLNDTRTGFGSFWSFVRTIKPEALKANPTLLSNPGKVSASESETQFFRCVDYLVQYDNVKFEYKKSKMHVVFPNTQSRGMTFRTPVDYTQVNRDPRSTDGSSILFNRVAHEYTMSMLLRDTFITNANATTPTLVRQGQTEALRVMDENTLFGQDVSGPNGIQERFTLPSINMRTLVEDVHRNNTFSLLAEARFKESYYIPTTCVYKTQGVIYKYHAFSLMVAYGVACFLTTIGLIVGIICFWKNGFVADFTFSRVLCTTRNPTLDELCRGDSCMGTASENVGHRRLRFGEVWIKGKKQHWTEPILSKIKGGLGIVQEESNDDVEEGHTKEKTLRIGHAAFGVHSEVVALKKGKAYA
ncbi:hypothetical protein DFH27DRAFT_536432 [Peziza echinospora]|nr:hypothetical protein DFH27DRAFT_536432 [Peziza echinospora]